MKPEVNLPTHSEITGQNKLRKELDSVNEGGNLSSRDFYAHCSDTEESFTFSGKGEIYSFSEVTKPPAGYEYQAPYWVALIKLEEGPMITAQLTDFVNNDLSNLPKIGMKVEMVTRILRQGGDRGLIIYGYKFRQPIGREIWHHYLMDVKP